MAGLNLQTFFHQILDKLALLLTAVATTEYQGAGGK